MLNGVAEGAQADKAAIALTVAKVAVIAPAEGSTPELTAVDLGSGSSGAILLWPIASLGGLLAVTALGLGALIVRRSRATPNH